MSYTVTYSAGSISGVTNLPSSQTKTDSVALTLSSTIPLRTGYVFVNWNTSQDGSGMVYNPGDSYATDANVTLYATWDIQTYDIIYWANEYYRSVDIKQHGVNYTIRGVPAAGTSRTFVEWNTSADGSGTAYNPGDTYTANASLTLYAIWEEYELPKITAPTGYKSPAVYRCNSQGNEDITGTYIRVKFNWKTSVPVSEIRVVVYSEIERGSPSGTSGTIDWTFGDGLLSTNSSYAVDITVTDSDGGSSTYHTILSRSFLTVDFGAGGKSIGVGGPAPDPTGHSNGLLKMFMDLVDGDNNFVDAIRHAVEIPNGADLNNYKANGFYCQPLSVQTSSMTNIPKNRGFWMISNYASANSSEYGNQIICFYAINEIYQRSLVGGTWYSWVLVSGPEEGTTTKGSIDWHWRKWISGQAEAWGVFPFTPASVSSLVTNWYYAYSTSGDIQLPFEFKSLDVFMPTISKSSGSGAIVEGNTQTPGTNITNLQILVMQAGSSIKTQYVNIYCRGTWKT